MTAASDRQLANWLRFTVSSGWGFPGEAARIPFERIASTSVSWEENLRRVEEYDPNLRSLRLQSHFGGLPGEIRDLIDFLAETDTRVSFEENVRDVVARHHLGPEWLEMGPREVITMEEVYEEVEGGAHLEAMVDELGKIVGDYAEMFPEEGKRELRRRLLGELLASFTPEEQGDIERELAPYVDRLLEEREVVVTPEMVEEMLEEEAGERVDTKIRPKEEVRVGEPEEEVDVRKLIGMKEVALEERNKKIVEVVTQRLEREHPDVDIEVSAKDSRVVIRGFVKEAFHSIFGKDREFEVTGKVEGVDHLVSKFSEMVNKARGQEFMPASLKGGLKILFPCPRMEVVFDIVERVSGYRLDEYSVKRAGAVCYLGFDLSRIGLSDRYRPTNQAFCGSLPYIIEELDESGEVDIVVDTSTGVDHRTELVYPIEFDQIDFVCEVEAEREVTPEERKTLQDRAIAELGRMVEEKLGKKWHL